MKRFLLCVTFPLVLFAQDAGMVLRTTVTYNTQKATLQLTDDQRHQADDFLREAQQANQAGKYGDALRSLYQGLAVMRNVPWTPAFEFVYVASGASSTTPWSSPGTQVTLTLTPLYATPRAAGIKLNASLVLVPVKKDGAAQKPLGAPVAIDARGRPLHYAGRSARDARGRLHHRGPPGRRRRCAGCRGARGFREEPAAARRYASPSPSSACARVSRRRRRKTASLPPNMPWRSTSAPMPATSILPA